MSCSMILITNNPAFSSISHKSHKNLELIKIDGTPYDVIIEGRDRVHLGWKLLNHPLYGNFRPYHQPFRTLILSSPDKGDGYPVLDEMSLSMLDNAISIYESCSDRWITPENAPKGMYDDGSVIDYDLMKEPLLKVGIL